MNAYFALMNSKRCIVIIVIIIIIMTTNIFMSIIIIVITVIIMIIIAIIDPQPARFAAECYRLEEAFVDSGTRDEQRRQ